MLICLNEKCKNSDQTKFIFTEHHIICDKCEVENNKSTMKIKEMKIKEEYRKKFLNTSYIRFNKLLEYGLKEDFFIRHEDKFNFNFEEFQNSMEEYHYKLNLPYSNYDRILNILLEESNKYDLNKLAYTISNGHHKGRGGLSVLTPYTCMCGAEEMASSSLIPIMCKKCSKETALSVVKYLEGIK